MEVRQIKSDALQFIEDKLVVVHTLVVVDTQVVKGSMELEVSHRQVVGDTFEGVVDISLDNLEVGIEEHTVMVDTMEVHHIEVSRIVASLDNIEEADHIEVVGFNDDARRLLL